LEQQLRLIASASLKKGLLIADEAPAMSGPLSYCAGDQPQLHLEISPLVKSISGSPGLANRARKRRATGYRVKNGLCFFS
jgi:hypothetical protein